MAFITSIIPDLVGLIPTSLMTIEESLIILAPTIKNDAEEISPGT